MGVSIGSFISAIMVLLIAGVKFKRRVHSRRTVPQMTKLQPPEPATPCRASGEHELDGEEHFGMEIDGVRLSGHEMSGYCGHELSENEWIYELYGDDSHD